MMAYILWMGVGGNGERVGIHLPRYRRPLVPPAITTRVHTHCCEKNNGAPGATAAPALPGFGGDGIYQSEGGGEGRACGYRSHVLASLPTRKEGNCRVCLFPELLYSEVTPADDIASLPTLFSLVFVVHVVILVAFASKKKHRSGFCVRPVPPRPGRHYRNFRKATGQTNASFWPEEEHS